MGQENKKQFHDILDSLTSLPLLAARSYRDPYNPIRTIALFQNSIHFEIRGTAFYHL